MKKQSLIVYDGDCGICEKCRRWVERLDWRHRFTFRSLHDSTLYSEYSQLRYERCLEQMYLVEPSGKTFGGADAVIRIALFLPLLSWLGLIFHLWPLKALARPVYRWFASNRLKFGGSCKVK